MMMLYLGLNAGSSIAAMWNRVYCLFSEKGRAIKDARDAGVCIDKDGNIDAQMSYANMLHEQQQGGRKFDRKQEQFLELLRIVYEGPKSIEEIEFLFDEGINPVVRPDGTVYVPCIENEHLSMDGEIELQREDLQTFVDNQLLKLDDEIVRH